MYAVFTTEVQQPNENGYIAIDDVAVLKGKCLPLSCGFQDPVGSETFCLWNQVSEEDSMDWILNKGKSPNYPESGPLRERGDANSNGCFNDTDATLMENMWNFMNNNSQKACLDFVRTTEAPGNRYTGLRNG